MTVSVYLCFICYRLRLQHYCSIVNAGLANRNKKMLVQRVLCGAVQYWARKNNEDVSIPKEMGLSLTLQLKICRGPFESRKKRGGKQETTTTDGAGRVYAVVGDDNGVFIITTTVTITTALLRLSSILF
jgi:hypothetical protein